MENINVLTIILDLLITIFGYMIIPFIKFRKGKKENYSNKRIRIFLVINSAYIAFIFIIIQVFILKLDASVISLAPALFYYYINSFLWLNKNQTNSKNFKKTKRDIKKKINISTMSFIAFTIICVASIIFNIFLGITNYKNCKMIKELKNDINEISKSKNRYEELYNLHQNSTSFLNNYVAIIPENEEVYLTYNRWKNSKFENKKFYIMSINDAKNKGYSDKYMQSPIPIEIYNELYFNN